MSVISIDFGNENFVVASPGRGGVDVLSNQASKRLNPTMVAFDNERRYAGIFAQTQQASNFAGTISNLKRLIGIKSNDTEKKVLKRLISAPLVDLPDGSTGVELKYNNKKSVFRIEQLLSLLISECFKISMANSLITKDCVIVVSPWWGEKQRRVVLDAAEICGFNVLKLLNSPTAAAVAYSAFNRTKLPTEADKSVSVLIADIGDSSMNVVVAQLYQGSVEVRGFCTDEHLGGSHFTDAFEEFLLQKTKQKYRLDPSSNPRAMFRFRKSVEVTKKTLSINPVTRFDVPSLMNDVDVSFEVKRDEFESVIVSLVNRIEFPLAEALKLANIESKDLFAIEIHGGGSRVPAVKKKIAAVLGKEPTQSLNPDECFAVGAGFQAAILSPQYKVNLDVKDVSPHSVFVEYLDLDQKRQRIEIFQKFNVVPSTKKVPIKVIRKALITVSTDEDEIGKIEIDTEKEEILLIQVLIRLSPNSLIELKQAAYYVTEEIEEPAEKEGEEPKKKTVKKEIKVKSSYSHSFGLKAEEIAKLKQLEKEMSHKDDLEERTDEIRNELESLIFRLSNGITRDFPEYFDPSKKKEFLAKVLDVQNWFSENEFERLTLAEYESKLKQLKEIGDPAIKRKEARDTLPKVLKDFEEEADNLYNRLTKKDANLSHITQEERDPVIKQIQDFKAWLIQKKEAVEKSPHHLDIPFKKSDAEHKRNDIERAVNTCLAKPKPPPPPPPKEEPKEGETKEESKEAAEDLKEESNKGSSDDLVNSKCQNPPGERIHSSSEETVQQKHPQFQGESKQKSSKDKEELKSKPQSRNIPKSSTSESKSEHPSQSSLKKVSKTGGESSMVPHSASSSQKCSSQSHRQESTKKSSSENRNIQSSFSQTLDQHNDVADVINDFILSIPNPTINGSAINKEHLNYTIPYDHVSVRGISNGNFLEHDYIYAAYLLSDSASTNQNVEIAQQIFSDSYDAFGGRAFWLMILRDVFCELRRLHPLSPLLQGPPTSRFLSGFANSIRRYPARNGGINSWFSAVSDLFDDDDLFYQEFGFI